MKKILICTLCLISVFALFSCAPTTKTIDAEGGTTISTPRYTFAEPFYENITNSKGIPIIEISVYLRLEGSLTKDTHEYVYGKDVVLVLDRSLSCQANNDKYLAIKPFDVLWFYFDVEPFTGTRTFDAVLYVYGDPVCSTSFTVTPNETA